MTNHQSTDLLRERLDTLAKSVALIGEGELSAVGATRFRNPPCDRPAVCNPQDQASLAAQETRGFRHDRSRCAADLLWHSGRDPSSTRACSVLRLMQAE
jgi:hypothetical protein